MTETYKRRYKQEQLWFGVLNCAKPSSLLGYYNIYLQTCEAVNLQTRRAENT